jgi:hypothetical protein
LLSNTITVAVCVQGTTPVPKDGKPIEIRNG